MPANKVTDASKKIAVFIIETVRPKESPPSFPVIPRSVKGFMNRFNAGESSWSKMKNPGSLGATSRGGGTS
jgi:hypothetical protein